MQLQELIQVPAKLRDQNWDNQFLHAFAESNIEILGENPINGPDGWPYLLADTHTLAIAAESEMPQLEPSQKVLNWLSTRGIGLVINPKKDFPDYVLTYGMIWFFRQTARFFMPIETPSEPKSGNVDVKSIRLAGPPTEEYLPGYVRKILGEFFRDQGILNPKILVIGTGENSYDLVFSKESLRNPVEAEHKGILEAISWFLPPHYSIILASEVGLPEFVSL